MSYIVSREQESEHLRGILTRDKDIDPDMLLGLVKQEYRARGKELERKELATLSSKVSTNKLLGLFQEVRKSGISKQFEYALLNQMNQNGLGDEIARMYRDKDDALTLGDLFKGNVVSAKVIGKNEWIRYGQAKQKLEETAKNDTGIPFYVVENGKIRQNTDRENLEARVHCLETKHNADGSERTPEERIELFETWLDSCTGCGYRKSSEDVSKNDEFKLVVKSPDLIGLSHNFAQRFLSINYNSLDGIRLLHSKGIYNQPLTREKILTSEFHLAKVDYDVKFLGQYIDALEEAFRIKKELDPNFKIPKKFMGAYIRNLNSISQDQLRALCVVNLVYGSDADDYWNLYDDDARFALVSQNQPRNPKG